MLTDRRLLRSQAHGVRLAAFVEEILQIGTNLINSASRLSSKKICEHSCQFVVQSSCSFSKKLRFLDLLKF